MKKLAYLLATAALAACSGNPNGYTIKGSIAGATDGEMVYLQKVEGRQYVALDSAIIANELGVNIRITSGPAIERPGDLAAILTNPKYFQDHRNSSALNARKRMLQRYMRYAESP